jgi:hypothetical protein
VVVVVVVAKGEYEWGFFFQSHKHHILIVLFFSLFKALYIYTN